MRTRRLWGTRSAWIERLTRGTRGSDRRNVAVRPQDLLAFLREARRLRESTRKLRRRWRTKGIGLGDDQIFIFRVLHGTRLRLNFQFPLILRPVSQRLSVQGARLGLTLIRLSAQPTTISAAPARTPQSQVSRESIKAPPPNLGQRQQVGWGLKGFPLLQAQRVDRTVREVRESIGLVTRAHGGRIVSRPVRLLPPLQLITERSLILRRLPVFVTDHKAFGRIVPLPIPASSEHSSSEPNGGSEAASGFQARSSAPSSLVLRDRLPNRVAVWKRTVAASHHGRGTEHNYRLVTKNYRAAYFSAPSRTGRSLVSGADRPASGQTAILRHQPNRKSETGQPAARDVAFPLVRSAAPAAAAKEKPSYGRDASFVLAAGEHRESTSRRSRTQEEEELLVRRIQRKLEEEVFLVERKLNEKVLSPQDLTDQIYSRLTRRLQIEKERLGY